jgi:hypothetical protein
VRSSDLSFPRQGDGFIEAIIEFLLSILWEVLLQLAGEGLLEGAWGLLGEPFRQRGRAHPVLAGIVLVLIGGAMGWILWLVFPARMVTSGGIPGASLILSPILAGLVMDRYGRWCESRGAAVSYTAKFWGGASFAFGMASARFLLIGRR